MFSQMLTVNIAAMPSLLNMFVAPLLEIYRLYFPVPHCMKIVPENNIYTLSLFIVL